MVKYEGPAVFKVSLSFLCGKIAAELGGKHKDRGRKADQEQNTKFQAQVNGGLHQDSCYRGGEQRSDLNIFKKCFDLLRNEMQGIEERGVDSHVKVRGLKDLRC